MFVRRHLRKPPRSFGVSELKRTHTQTLFEYTPGKPLEANLLNELSKADRGKQSPYSPQKKARQQVRGGYPEGSTIAPVVRQSRLSTPRLGFLSFLFFSQGCTAGRRAAARIGVLLYTSYYYYKMKLFLDIGIFFSSTRGSFVLLSVTGHAGGLHEHWEQVWALADVRGTCSGGSKSRKLVNNHGIAFRPASANQAHANPKQSSISVTRNFPSLFSISERNFLFFRR